MRIIDSFESFKIITKKILTSTKLNDIILNVASDEVDDCSLKTKQSRN
jgi:hypothetical protein